MKVAESKSPPVLAAGGGDHHKGKGKRARGDFMSNGQIGEEIP